MQINVLAAIAETAHGCLGRIHDVKNFELLASPTGPLGRAEDPGGILKQYILYILWNSIPASIQRCSFLARLPIGACPMGAPGWPELAWLSHGSAGRQ